MLTIYDIAKESGVSISTVSRVLNNPEMVRASTRKRVEDVLKKHNYAPNAMARGLVQNSMKTIGIMTVDVTHHTFSATAAVLEDCFFQWGYSSMLCNTGNTLEKKKDYIRILSSKKPDGLVLLGSIFSDDQISEEIHRYMPRIPVVISNGSLSVENAYCVFIDHDYGVRCAIEHLVEKGHHDIGFVSSVDSFNTQRKRNAFQNALAEHHLADKKTNYYRVPHSLEGGAQVADALCENKVRPSALLFVDDLTAFGAVKQFHKLGIDVPEDIAVVGYDNSIFSLCADPELTTVDTKSYQLATVVANVLHDAISDREMGNMISLRPELVVRQST